MSPRPEPTTIVHFTHLRNLPGIIAQGMWSDAACRARGLTQVEIGDLDIRERRLHLPVDAGPGGYVGDYVPFYFGPRSPMMFRLLRTDDVFRAHYDDVAYLVSTVESQVSADRRWVASNRNAALDLAEFVAALTELDEHVSWDVIRARYWGDFPDGKDRRMAEFLVHDSVPWESVGEIVVRSQAASARVLSMLDGAAYRPRVIVRPGWYF